MQRLCLLFAILLSLSLFGVSPASAASQAAVSEDEPEIEFPNAITFRARISASTQITSVILEYGTEQLTCGEVIAKAFPPFEPSTSVNVEWTWDMRQSGSLPPGATIWWHWRYTDEHGRETVSDQKTITWLDEVHNWQTISTGQLHLRWYGRDRNFAEKMMNAGLTGLERNEKMAGLGTSDPIDIYVYPNYEDLREAILYESSWTGGVAYPEHNIVIMGLAPSESSWDEGTLIHELTHVLVGHLTFSCLGYVPQWLNEGLAVYSEGPLDPQFQEPLQQAIQNDTLLSIRSISGAFSEISDKANLSYGQSYSIAKFLIETHGQDKMTALLTSLRDGVAVDDALMQSYGFDTEGLEDEWRNAIGAKPRHLSAQATAQPTPTFVPTIVPISGAPLASSITPTPIPTSSFNEQPADQRTLPGGPPIALTLILLGLCCTFLVVIGVIALGVVVRSQNRRGGHNG